MLSLIYLFFFLSSLSDFRTFCKGKILYMLWDIGKSEQSPTLTGGCPKHSPVPPTLAGAEPWRHPSILFEQPLGFAVILEQVEGNGFPQTVLLSEVSNSVLTAANI